MTFFLFTFYSVLDISHVIVILTFRVDLSSQLKDSGNPLTAAPKLCPIGVLVILNSVKLKMEMNHPKPTSFQSDTLVSLFEIITLESGF